MLSYQWGVVYLSAFITTNNLYNIEEKGFKKISLTGYIIIIINVVIIVLSILQFTKNKSELRKNEKIALQKQNERDSILRARYDSSLFEMKQKYDTSNLKTITVLAELLGKYGFKLDSANQRLLKIVRDSAKTKVILPNDPVLQLCPKKGIEFSKNQNRDVIYNLCICSFDAASTNLKIQCPVIIEDSIGNLTFLGDAGLSTDSKIAKDNYITSYISVPDTLSYNYLYIWLTGSYTNLDNTKTYNLDDLYYYNTRGKTFGALKGDTKIRITLFMMKNFNARQYKI